MPQCSRCSEVSNELDDRGRCAICQYELNRQREWNKNRRTSLRITSKQYYEQHRERILAKRRKYYQQNREVLLEQNKQYRMANREVLNAKARERARKRKSV